MDISSSVAINFPQNLRRCSIKSIIARGQGHFLFTVRKPVRNFAASHATHMWRDMANIAADRIEYKFKLIGRAFFAQEAHWLSVLPNVQVCITVNFMLSCTILLFISLHNRWEFGLPYFNTLTQLLEMRTTKSISPGRSGT
jgi:hypothetical protein